MAKPGRKKTKKGAGRPKIIIDWTEFKKLCQMQCTLEEIAYWFRCSEDTIERRCKEEKKYLFAEFYKKNSARGKISIRRAQFVSAKDGNVTMLIWMGKQYLNQKDKHETAVELTGKDGGPVKSENKTIMTTQEIEDELKKRGLPVPEIGGEDL